MKSLYPFQQALVDRVRSHWRAGVQRVGLWPAPGKDLPRGYTYDPACGCDVCQTLKSRKEQS